MAKRGPKQKSGARYACGKLRPASDGPTPEHARHRRDAVGTDDPKKQPLAENHLGINYARHDITGTEFSAGARYGRLFRAAVFPLVLPSILGNLVASGGFAVAMAALDNVSDLDRGATDRAQFLAARKALGRCGSRVAAIVDEVAVYDQPIAAAKGQVNHADFCRGLDALHAHFERADAASRAARA